MCPNYTTPTKAPVDNSSGCVVAPKSRYCFHRRLCSGFAVAQQFRYGREHEAHHLDGDTYHKPLGGVSPGRRGALFPSQGERSKQALQ